MKLAFNNIVDAAYSLTISGKLELKNCWNIILLKKEEMRLQKISGSLKKI